MHNSIQVKIDVDVSQKINHQKRTQLFQSSVYHEESWDNIKLFVKTNNLHRTTLDDGL